MNKETFNQELKKLNIELTPKQETNLEKYYNLLVETNQTTNLTRITNKKEVYLKHFYDSLTITKVITLTNQKIIDIGSGAGFPGLVLKIIYKDLDITLLDSISKKNRFSKQSNKRTKPKKNKNSSPKNWRLQRRKVRYSNIKSSSKNKYSLRTILQSSKNKWLLHIPKRKHRRRTKRLKKRNKKIKSKTNPNRKIQSSNRK